MPRAIRGTGLPDRASKRASSAGFPRWLMVSFTLVIGLILWLGVLKDPDGGFAAPGAGSIVYVAVVVGVAAFLAYVDRKGDSS